MQHLKVYVWRPKYRNVGHGSLELPDGTYISWWPDGECSRNSPSRPPNPHTDFQQDAKAEGETYPPTFYIKVNTEQIDGIKKWWTEYKEKENYHIIDRNCSTVVYLALKVAFPSLESLSGKVKVWVPLAIQKVAEYLVAEVSDFGEKVDDVANAADKEAREIVANGGVKSSKITIEKVRKVLCKAESEKAIVNKKLAEEVEEESTEPSDTGGKKGKQKTDEKEKTSKACIKDYVKDISRTTADDN